MSKRIDRDWYPEEEGEMLAGRLIDAMTVEGTRYGDVDIAVIEDHKTGEKVGCWLTPKMLRAKFEEERPAPETLIVVRYWGKRPSKAGHEYKVFTVVCEDHLEDWDKLWIDAYRAALPPLDESPMEESA